MSRKLDEALPDGAQRRGSRFSPVDVPAPTLHPSRRHTAGNASNVGSKRPTCRHSSSRIEASACSGITARLPGPWQ